MIEIKEVLRLWLRGEMGLSAAQQCATCEPSQDRSTTSLPTFDK
ncbi:MAG: hypothetical protein WEB03_16245 [Nitriliruptor sp.]